MRSCARPWSSRSPTSSSKSPQPSSRKRRWNKSLCPRPPSRRRSSAVTLFASRIGASFLGLALVAFAGCSRCGLQPDAGVKIVVPAMPTTLDWQTSDPTSWSNYPVMLATMRGLTSLGADNRIGPGLATHWERQQPLDGHEVYTFHLRTDVKWSDGVSPLCAQDFVVGWRRATV